MNEDRKAQFLSEQNRKVGPPMVLFRAVAPYEEQRNEDVCMFSAEVLQEILNKNFGVTSHSTKSNISLLKAYNKWCQEKGYETSNGIYKVEPDTSDKVRRKMVSSPKHLAIRLDEAYTPVSDETIDCLYRSLFWLVYMGIELRSALEIKTADVDLENLIVTHGGRVYEIYREAVPAFRVAHDANSFNYHTRIMTYYRRVRQPGEYFLRGLRGTKPEYEAYRSQAVRSMRTTKDKLTFTNVHLSGLFYRAYEMERCGIEPDFAMAEFQSGASVSASWGRANDYEIWKKAFG